MGGPVVRLEGIINELRANHLLASTTVAIHKGIEQVIVHYVSHVSLLYLGRKCPFASALTIDAQRMANENCSELVISKSAYQKSDISDSSEDSSSAFLPDPINFDAAGSAFIGVQRCS